MARQYSLKKFLRQAPNGLLRRYLEGKGTAGGMLWRSLKETARAPSVGPLKARRKATAETSRQTSARSMIWQIRAV